MCGRRRRLTFRSLQFILNIFQFMLYTSLFIFTLHCSEFILQNSQYTPHSPIAYSVGSLTLYSGVTSSILARSYTFLEIDHEIISTVILHLRLIQQPLLSVTTESMCTKYCYTAKSSLPRKKVWLGEVTCLDITIASDWSSYCIV